jgi:DGQHR domain-containing protein
MNLNGTKILRRRALQIKQNDSCPLYLFSLTGDDLQRIAEISRISRDDAGTLIGYQRPEVKRHVQEIVEYLNGKDVLFPNSLILALTTKVRFVKSREPDVSDGMAISGTLEIPLPRANGAKPAWIVDGQQRALALSMCKGKNLPIPINAFVSDEVGLQRDQFLRVNNTKPLPRGLITELLPAISTQLPTHLSARRIPSAICDWLNQDERSPFRGLIRRASTAKADKEETVVTDTSIVKVIEESLTSPSGCLFPYRNIATSETDFDGICSVLVTYWSAVKATFPNAWGKPLSQSRLMHGAGLRSMGRLMDRVMSGIDLRVAKAVVHAKRELQMVAPICRWTEGAWEDLNDTRWDEITSHPRHVRVLSNFLIRTYLYQKNERSSQNRSGKPTRRN